MVFKRPWLLLAMIVVLAGIGFAIGYQKHVLWLGIVLAFLGAALAWYLWRMIRIALFTVLGAVVGGIALGLFRGDLWHIGALAGAVLGYLAGRFWHRRSLIPKQSPAPPKPQ